MNSIFIIGIILSGLGTLGIGILYFFRKYRQKKYMNLVSSLSLIAGATLLAIGSFKTDNRVIESINDFNQRLNIIINDTTINLDLDSLYTIENEFNIWAQNFVKDKEIKKVNLKKSELNQLEEKLKINNEWIEFYNFFISKIESIVTAYNNYSDEKINLTVNYDHLTNIFDEDLIDSTLISVNFHDSVIWKICIHDQTVKTSTTIPEIRINLTYNRKVLPKDIVTIIFIPDISFFNIEYVGSLLIFCIKNNNEFIEIVPRNNPLNSYESYLGDYLTRIFEYQILILDQL
jgi:hypothetical protein